MSDFAELLKLVFVFLVVGGALGGATWLLWVAGVQGWAFYRERMAQATIAEARAATARADVAMVRPVDGVLPLHRAAIEQSTDAIMGLLAARIDAMRPPANVPTTITYSPSYAPHMRNQVEQLPGARLADLPQLTMNAAPIADFWALYHQGALPDHGFLMGHSLDDGAPVLADWQKLYSALIGGQSGSGKSTLIRCLLAQSAMQGGRFVVIDPHMGSGDQSLAESLAPMRRLMLTAPASSDDEIRDALAFVEATGRARLAGKDPDRTPLILVVDELTGLLRRGAVKDELLAGLGLIAQETRKVGVYALGIGQQFQAELFPSQVRNAFVSFVSCRARRDTARVMSGSNDFGKLAEQLTTGQAVWMTPQGAVARLAVPNTTAHHIELVARQVEGGRWDATGATANHTTGPLPEPRLLGAPGSVSGSENGSVTGSDITGVDTTLTLDNARAARVRAAIKSGMTKSEIMADVWGVDMKKGGRAVTRASTEYDEIVRALVA